MAALRLTAGLRLAWRVHRWLFRVSGGRVMPRVRGFEVLLLTTRGRRSGEPRRAALQSLEHGSGWAVIASRAGDVRHPDWYRNLMAEPAAEVMTRGRRTAVRAREASGDEREELWRRFVSVDEAFEEYARRAGRRIPVVVLERVAR